MSWASDFPEELLCRPLGLVALTGLDITYNALHKVIWDSFCNNRRSDRVQLNFQVTSTDHEYPKCTSKRTSYEWYVPKGILKKNWMVKQLKEIPAVVVMFFDLDWDDPLWKERQMECSTKVEIVRTSLLGRSTKVAVVLIQRNAPLPPGEDVVAVERAALLCSACELSAKSLFVLPLTDHHLLGYTIRLENAFYELAQSYYQTEARKVKAHKDFLNKTTHQLLFVRHQFKIAFYNELKQDSHTTLKHYKQAYSHLLDLRIHDTNLLEVKTIAGFINYKICRFCFQHITPADAIAQFRKHNDFFKNHVGPEQLAFEHSAWMAKQFQVFGDLFDEAIKLGLTAIHTQHPGFYYQQAANHAIRRKQLYQSVPAPSSAGNQVLLDDIASLEYYGQRPWRQGHQSNDPPDLVQEKEGITSLQQLEGSVDHSCIIIPLLSSAVAQFRKYKSPRMKRYIMVQMAEQYEQSHDYTKVLALLSRVIWEYRQDGWKRLFTTVLLTSLRCAYMLADIQQYVSNSLELIGKYSCSSREEKTRIQMNLIRAMSNECPEIEPGCDQTHAEKAKMRWKALSSSNFPINMHSISSFVECRALFVERSFTADSVVSVKIQIRSSCEFPMKFTKLSVQLNNQCYNDQCTLTCDKSEAETSLYVVPQQTKEIIFNFSPHADDVGKIIEILCVSLELGQAEGRCAVLQWAVGQQTNDTQTRIDARKSNLQLSLDYALPCLVNEFFCVSVNVDNLEQKDIKNVCLTVSCGCKIADNVEVSFENENDGESPELQSKLNHRDVSLGTMTPAAQITKCVYIKSQQLADIKLSVKLTYDIEGDSGVVYSCESSNTVMLTAVNAFDIETQLNNLQFEPCEMVNMEESFVVHCRVKSVSSLPIKIKSSHLDLSPFVVSTDKDASSQLEQLTLTSDDIASECYCLQLSPNLDLTQTEVPLGNYVITWRRDNDKIPWSNTVVSLPQISVQRACVSVYAETCAHARMRCSMPITYIIQNQSAYAHQLQATLSPSDAFMFSGPKKLNMRLLPHHSHRLRYNLVPLLPGNVSLPVLQLSMQRYADGEQVNNSQLPTHIYVLPSGKSSGA